MTLRDTRARSATIFNNDKFVEVVLALERERPAVVTAQQLAHAIGINHDLVTKVLRRLHEEELVKQRDRIGGRRGALPYEVQDGEEWQALVGLARALAVQT
jgi:ribosomal protein S25